MLRPDNLNREDLSLPRDSGAGLQRAIIEGTSDSRRRFGPCALAGRLRLQTCNNERVQWVSTGWRSILSAAFTTCVFCVCPAWMHTLCPTLSARPRCNRRNERQLLMSSGVCDNRSLEKVRGLLTLFAWRCTRS